MRTAVFSDIHSNFPALEACFRDARNRGAECFLFLGDFVSDLSYPRETMDLIYRIREEFPCYFVRGNREDYMLRCWAGEAVFLPGSKSGSLLYTYQNLRQEDLDFFRSLPIYRQIEIDGLPLEIAHAERETDRRVYTEEDPHVDAVFSDMRTRLMFTGHSHRQYIRQKENKTLINPGSLGIPQGQPGYAQYALADISREVIECRLCRVSYDVGCVIRNQYESGLAALARFWSVSILNNLITGKNPMLELLTMVEAQSGTQDEGIWESSARTLGLALTREELLARLHAKA